MRETDDRQFEYLDEAERDLIESVENDEWKPVGDVDEVKKQARRQAMATLHRDERCNLQERELEQREGTASIASPRIEHTHEIDGDALEALASSIKRVSGTDVITREIVLKSFEAPSWIRILAEAPWWLQAFGACAALYVAELVKGAAKATVQALTNRDTPLGVFSSSLREFRKIRLGRTGIAIGLPVPGECFGTVLAVKADSLDDVEHEVAIFVYHLPRIIELMESEELSRNAVGMVQLVLVDEGNIEVRWIDESTFEERSRLLRHRST